MLRIIMIISALALCQRGIFAGVVGDTCTDPILAWNGQNYFDTTFNSSTLPEPDESQCPDTYLNWTSSPDVWFKFVPTDSVLHTFTTCDINSFDTSMVLYESSCSIQVACNGDDTNNAGCQPYNSAIEYNLIAGIAYYIRIGGFGGATGSGILTIDPQSGNGTTVWYVDASNTAPGSGTDWSSAFNTLQDALDSATGNDQIWIAQGTYRPTDTNGMNDPREASFRIHSALQVYGGFEGNETSLSQRRPATFRVYLTGDLLGDDLTGGDTSDNAYHVTQVDGATATEPLLDGLFIGRGNANSSTTSLHKYGAGLIVWNYSSASSHLR
jgi:hypothetical protein